MSIERDTHSEADDLKRLLPRPELVLAFGTAGLVMFAVIFSISAAVMSKPRDVRLATETHITVPRSAKAAPAVENAAIESANSVR